MTKLHRVILAFDLETNDAPNEYDAANALRAKMLEYLNDGTPICSGTKPANPGDPSATPPIPATPAEDWEALVGSCQIVSASPS